MPWRRKRAPPPPAPPPAAFARAFEAGDGRCALPSPPTSPAPYNAAVMAREMVLEEHPEKQICIIDSKSTSGAMALLIYRARELMKRIPPGILRDLQSAAALSGGTADLLYPGEFRQPHQNGRMRPPGGHAAPLPWASMSSRTPRLRAPSTWRTARGEAKTYRAITALMGTQQGLHRRPCDRGPLRENLAGAMKLKQQILEDLPVKEVEIPPAGA